LGLRWRILGVLLSVSLLPLVLLGVGSWMVFARLLEDKALSLLQSEVRARAEIVDLHLRKRLRALELVARSYAPEALRDPAVLEKVFDDLNRTYDNAYMDLGVIGSHGEHLAYAGPYALLDRNYSQTEWFREVKERGTYVSDIFLGFRKIPHCIIAVKQPGLFILRATISSERFEEEVRAGQQGKTEDAFIVNAAGLLQTPSREGRLMEQWPQGAPPGHAGVRHGRIRSERGALVQTTTWLNQGRWMLVVQESEAEIRAPLRRMMIMAVLGILLAMTATVMTTILATWHLTNKVDRATAQRDELSREFIRSAKLASLGEMAAGLAHEINNPLSVISAEQTNIADLIRELDGGGSAAQEAMASIDRCRRQVERCAGITTKMLHFGQSREARLVPTDIRPRLEEVVSLMRKQAAVQSVEILLQLEPDLPRLVLDPLELEQVMLNLMQNSLHAIAGAGQVRISAYRNGEEVQLSVHDTGCGIPVENLDRVFQPFFTTKPQGQGTGLGLSVCYGIVRGWGGTMAVRSEPRTGTVFTLGLPVAREGDVRHDGGGP
jgi:two-component system NtrC family sensor kinase